MAVNTQMSYGTYEFSPVPLMTISKEYQRSPDSTILDSLIVVTLNGTLTPLPNDSVAGLEATTDLQDVVRTAFDDDGKCFKTSCGGIDIFTGCPRIRTIQFDESSDNWVFTIPFTIELEFDDELTVDEDDTKHPPYIEEASDEWTVEFVEDHRHYDIDLSVIVDQQGGNYYGQDNNQLYQVRLTHNVSAKGKRHFTCPAGPGSGGIVDMEAWEQARNYVVPRLGLNWNRAQASGVLNLPTGSGNVFDHFRTNSIGELAGTFSVTESWLIIPSSVSSSGQDRALEDFTATVRKGIDIDITTVTIEGSIRGLETRNYGAGPNTYDVVEKAYQAANTYWNFIQPRVFSRVQYVGESEASRVFHPLAVTKSIGHNPAKGIITYNYEFNDRLCQFITGALSETFNMVDNYPTDIFAKIPVLGRARGPVLQEISTVSEQTREITIEAVMPLPTSCLVISDLQLNNPSSQVKTLLCDFETELTAAYEQVFKHSDTESFNPLTGRYSRAIGWTIQNCSGGLAPDTSMC